MPTNSGSQTIETHAEGRAALSAAEQTSPLGLDPQRVGSLSAQQASSNTAAAKTRAETGPTELTPEQKKSTDLFLARNTDSTFIVTEALSKAIGPKSVYDREGFPSSFTDLEAQELMDKLRKIAHACQEVQDAEDEATKAETGFAVAAGRTSAAQALQDKYDLELRRLHRRKAQEDYLGETPLHSRAVTLEIATRATRLLEGEAEDARRNLESSNRAVEGGKLERASGRDLPDTVIRLTEGR